MDTALNTMGVTWTGKPLKAKPIGVSREYVFVIVSVLGPAYLLIFTPK
jgi:hypothetical protein